MHETFLMYFKFKILCNIKGRGKIILVQIIMWLFVFAFHNWRYIMDRSPANHMWYHIKIISSLYSFPKHIDSPLLSSCYTVSFKSLSNIAPVNKYLRCSVRIKKRHKFPDEYIHLTANCQMYHFRENLKVFCMSVLSVSDLKSWSWPHPTLPDAVVNDCLKQWILPCNSYSSLEIKTCIVTLCCAQLLYCWTHYQLDKARNVLLLEHFVFQVFYFNATVY